MVAIVNGFKDAILDGKTYVYDSSIDLHHVYAGGSGHSQGLAG